MRESAGIFYERGMKFEKIICTDPLLGNGRHNAADDRFGRGNPV